MGSGRDEVLFSGVPSNPKNGLFYYVIDPNVPIGHADIEWCGGYGQVKAHPITARYIPQSDRAMGKIIEAQTGVRQECRDRDLDLSEFIVGRLAQDEIPTLALLHDITILAKESPEYIASALPSLKARLASFRQLLSDCDASLEILEVAVDEALAPA